MSKVLTDITCHVRAIRDKAIAVSDGTTEEHEGREREVWFWVPLSMIGIDPEQYDIGDEVVVTMPEWVAADKGLI